MIYFEVAPLVVVRQDAAVLTYEFNEPLPLGTVVTIPLGNRTVPGVVMKTVKKPDYETRPINTVVEPRPLPGALIKVADWMSRYYGVHRAIVMQSILPRGLQKVRRSKNHESKRVTRERKAFSLNQTQTRALRAIRQANQKTVLLHGITGSGKTAIYIEAIKQAVAAGKSAIVLTPEISLTPQLVAECSHHFEQIIVTHSQLSEANRHQQWRQALYADTPQVVIGPRSALFLPLRRVGIIIIDESHEPSYKQEQQPRYTAQRVARILANAHGAQLVLGTATPSVSEFYLARQAGVIVTLSEKARTNQSSRIQIIDASQRHNFSQNALFSNQLIEAIAEQLSAKKQVLLFHNRRGSASSILCEACGWHAACERCLLPLTLHADLSRLLCHICGTHYSVPPHCPICKQADIIFRGVGTKQIESEVIKLFPKAIVSRFDADSKQEGQLHNQYQAVYDGDIDIIIGTQLLAKGLDLPKLGLVGIVQADAGLLLPDFQARERVFQLVSQACGRVGRQEHQTEVIVQTLYPKDTIIQAAIQEDYKRFYVEEIVARKRGHYPPFTHLLKLVCAYKTEAGAVQASRKLASALRDRYKNIQVIGPTPAFYERLRGLYRWQIIIKSDSHQTLQNIAKQTPRNWQVELDPYSLIS